MAIRAFVYLIQNDQAKITNVKTGVSDKGIDGRAGNQGR